jgi:hypothetical protein
MSIGGRMMRLRTARMSAPPMTTRARGFSRLRADAVGEGGRQEAHHRDGRRHEHRAGPLPGREARALLERAAHGPPALGVGDDEDAVLHRDAEDGDEAHGRGDGAALARHEQRQHPAGAGDRDREDDEQRVAAEAHDVDDAGHLLELCAGGSRPG